MNEMDGLRRAALTLHGLLPADREWVLSQLDAADQERLSGLLAELTELGIPADRDLVRDSLADRLTPGVGQPSAISRLRQASAGQLYPVLADEPDGLIAQILAIDDWPWFADLMAMLGDDRRNSVAALLSWIDVKPAMRRVLVEQVAERIAVEMAATESHAVTPGTVARKARPFPSWFSASLRPWRR